MSRKREKAFFSRHPSASAAKRRRPLPPLSPPPEENIDKPTEKPPAPPALMIVGLPPDCSVLDLKSRFEIYGSISRIRIDRDGIGFLTYRTKESADEAVAASLDSSFGITVDSKKVEVLWATDPLAQWRKGINVGINQDNGSSSKLLRGEVPLSRHGRGNKLASTIVNPRNSKHTSGLDVPFKGREIVAYDDIL